MKVRAIRDRVLIRMEPDQTHGVDPGEGGSGVIITPDAYTYDSQRGVVVAVGPGRMQYDRRTRTDRLVPTTVRQGDRVEVLPNVGTRVTFSSDPCEYRSVHEHEIRAVIPEG